MENKYDIIDQSGKPINIIVWDGVSEWTPPENYTVEPHNPDRWNPTVVVEEGPRVWTEYDVRSKMNLTEKVKWDNDVDQSIVTSKIELRVPKQVNDVTEILNMLVASGVISETTKSNILA